MYLQETYISDEEALDIVLEYLWNEYDYETEEELYEAYDFLTDEEFEYILNENVFKRGFNALRSGVNAIRKSWDEQGNRDKAVKDFNKAKPNVSVTKSNTLDTGTSNSLANRVVPSASKQDKTSSVVPVKFGAKVPKVNPGSRKKVLAKQAEKKRVGKKVEEIKQKKAERKARAEQPGPNETPYKELNKRQIRDRTKDVKSRTPKTRSIPSANEPKFQEKPKKVGKNPTIIEPNTGRRRRKRATYVEPKSPKQNPVPEFKSGKKRSGGKGFDVKKPPTKEERRAKREARKVNKLRQNYKKPKAYTKQTPSYMSNDGKTKLNPSARDVKSTARSNRLKQAVKDGTPVFYGFNRSY